MGVSKGTIARNQDFYNYLLMERQVKRSTALAYISSHANFMQFSKQEFTYEKLLEYLSFKKESSSATYINNLRDYARTYTRYLKYKNLDCDERVFEIKKLKESDPVRTTMSDEEIELFLKYTPKRGRGFSMKRYKVWTLFFSILAYTGMRPNEVAQLTIDTVDFGRSVFVIRPEHSKTNKLRFVPIPPNLKEKIQKHIEGISKKHLFMQNDKPFDNVDWHYNFKKRLEWIGLKRTGVSPYSLRHSYITRLIEEDVNIFKVQKLVGHSRIDTTARYTHLATKDMQKTILKHPAVRRGMEKSILADMVIDYAKGLGIDIVNYDFSKNILNLKMRLK